MNEPYTVTQALAALDDQFGTWYDFWTEGGMFHGRRVDGSGGTLTGSTPAALAAAAAVDLASLPAPPAVPRDRDDLMRLARYRRSHPVVVIGRPGFGTWQALIPEPAGETVITRHSLGELLDRLEELD